MMVHFSVVTLVLVASCTSSIKYLQESKDYKSGPLVYVMVSSAISTAEQVIENYIFIKICA